MESEVQNQSVDIGLSQTLQYLTPSHGIDVSLLLVGLADATDDRLALEISRLAEFRRSGQRSPLRIVCATAVGAEHVDGLLRQHRPSVLHVRKSGEEQATWLEGTLASLVAFPKLKCAALFSRTATR